MLFNRMMVTVFVCLFLYLPASAQSTSNRGWVFLSHKQELSARWDLLFDGQARSTEELRHVGTLLLRGALSYNFRKIHSGALGYTYKGDWEYEEGSAHYQPEHRVFEQYMLNTHAGKAELTARFRLEQRFIKEEDDYLFSQRMRYFLTLQLPLAANADFSKGVYTKLQNEIFFNLQNKKNVNNSFFDQNRAQAGLGYRWSKKLDTDLSYMYWRQKEKEGPVSSNVFILMFTTSF